MQYIRCSPPVIGFSEKDELNKRRRFINSRKMIKLILTSLTENYNLINYI